MTEVAEAITQSPAHPVPTTLAGIKRPIESDLKQFRRYFRDSMRSDIRLLDLVVRYQLRRKGKQIRPVLVLLSSSVCGGVSQTSYLAAALVELLHTATLVHDDVVDGAERRRGIPSINAIWKNRVSVLFGDFLLSQGLLLALKNNAYDLLHVVSDAVRRMSEGELRQMDKARKLDVSEETYFRIISDKTASLFSACTTCGAIGATDDADAIQSMREFGEKLGLAFQIRDDLFDLGGADVGKPLGNDLRERKITLPLIHALRSAPEGDRRKIIRVIRSRKLSQSDVRAVASFARQHGGLSYARDRMEQFASEAKGALTAFRNSEAKSALMGLVDFVVKRTR